LGIVSSLSHRFNNFCPSLTACYIRVVARLWQKKMWY